MKQFALFILLISVTALNASAYTKDSLQVSEEAKNNAKQQLQLIRDRISNGENFNTLAAIYSEDSGSASKGGCYESVKRGAFVPEFEEVAFRLNVNEISAVFETQYGYHIVLLKAKRGDELDVCHILIIP